MSNLVKLPERIIGKEKAGTLRPISRGAEKWMYRPIPCLDHGFVYLVDYMGNDHSVAEAARVSYGRGTRKVSEDEMLVRYLRRNLHTSPSEMVEFKFHCKMPIFVARQWIRHRTANVNEYSGRYSEMSDEFYMPDPAQLCRQASDNKQGRGDALSPKERERAKRIFECIYGRAWRGYRELLSMDLAKELARIGLSVGNYTEWYWKMDVHNLFHFLRLRLDRHAQYEIRVYAEAIARIARDALPVSYRAFEQYVLRALHLSEMEIAFIARHPRKLSERAVREKFFPYVGNKREVSEFVHKMKRLHLLAA